MDISEIVNNFCCENGISVKLSYDMPGGYETAYGTYNVTINTLFLNMAILEDSPKYEMLFYLFHELRHAMQYLRPNLFSESIQESIFYVVMYNGICYKLIDNMWQKCDLEGDEECFSLAYMSLPYEIDANKFAYEKAKEICGDISELQELYAFWIPENILDYSEHQKLFRRIDNELKKYEYKRNITLELLSRRNIEYVRQIQRDDISEAFVDNTDTIMELTQYGLDHSCKGHTYAIKRDDEYIGLILMGEALEWDTDPEEMKGVPFYRLMGFIIDKRYRNGGIGGYVLEKVIEIIYNDYGIRPIALGVHKDNIGAERFYLNHGFKKTEVIEGNDYYYLRYPNKTTINCVWEHNGNDTLLYAVDYVGAYTRGENLDIAKAKMPAEISSYLKWCGENTSNDFEIVITGEKVSDLNIKDADSDVLFESEKSPLTLDEYEKLKALALKSAKDFLALYESIPDKRATAVPERKTFYGNVPRSADEMYEHTKNINEYYFAEIDVNANNNGNIYECRKRGFEQLEAKADYLNNAVIEGSYGEDWSLRKVFRRFIWHDRIHAKAMYRMAVKVFGAENVANPFYFE